MGARRVVLARGEAVLEDAEIDTLDEALDHLCLRLRECARRPRLRLWLGGSLCRPFVIEQPGALRSAAERAAAAQALGQAVIGQPVRCWLQPSRSPRPCLGAAVSTAVVESCESRLGALHRGALTVSPWWAEATKLPLGEAAGWLVDDGESLTLLAVRDGAIAQVCTAAPMVRAAMPAALRRWRTAGEVSAGGLVRLTLLPRPRLEEPAPAVPPRGPDAGWRRVPVALASLAERSHEAAAH